MSDWTEPFVVTVSEEVEADLKRTEDAQRLAKSIIAVGRHDVMCALEEKVRDTTVDLKANGTELLTVSLSLAAMVLFYLPKGEDHREKVYAAAHAMLAQFIEQFEKRASLGEVGRTIEEEAKRNEALEQARVTPSSDTVQ